MRAQEAALHYCVALGGQKQERQESQERQSRVANFTLLFFFLLLLFYRPPWRLLAKLVTFSSFFGGMLVETTIHFSNKLI